VGIGSLSTFRRLEALTSLRHLTSLSLDKDAGRFEVLPIHAYGDGSAPGGLAVWKALAAIPRLARLFLKVQFNYHTPMPEVAPMTALTHLALFCTEEMVERDVQLAVEVPVLQLLRLVPSLASLQLWNASRVATSAGHHPSSSPQAVGSVAEVCSA
jgi:hypothetical protein